MITFRDADERIAWDRFVAAGISHPDMTFKQVLSPQTTASKSAASASRKAGS